MYFLIPLPFFLVFAYLAQCAKAAKDFAHAAIYQPLTTVFLIAIALLSLLNKESKKKFTCGVTIGLVFSFGGDFTIINPDDPIRLMIGLVFFLIAQCVYAAYFTSCSGFKKQDTWTGILVSMIFIWIMVFLGSDLVKQGMTIPVGIYALAISFMLWRAASTIFGTYFTHLQSISIALGALLFFAADLQLAISLYGSMAEIKNLMKEWSANYGLYWYFGGQLLIAISPSLFRLRGIQKKGVTYSLGTTQNLRS